MTNPHQYRSETLENFKVLRRIGMNFIKLIQHQFLSKNDSFMIFLI